MRVDFSGASCVGAGSVVIWFGGFFKRATNKVETSLFVAMATLLTFTVSNFVHAITFNYTGAVQTWVVPANVGQVTLEVWGGQGGTNAGGVVGGLGGYSKGTLTVTPGETLYIFVGGGGSTATAGFFNGGGDAGAGATPPASVGGGGGGATDVRRGGNALADRVIVAGGGGGAGGNRVLTIGRGSGGGGGGGYYGGGGGAAWPSASATPTPTGGSQSAGGTGGTSTYSTIAPGNNGTDGALGQGGNGGAETTSNQAGSQAGAVGGDGGGLTGGNGLYAANFTGSSGAGGSSYIGGVTAGTTTAGVRTGAGMAEITVSQLLTPQTLTFSPAPTVLVNGTGTVSATSATPNSGNAITYSTTSTDCSVTSAGVVTGISAGTNNCVITATQAGDATYAQATATLTFNIGQAGQVLSFPAQTPPSRTFVLNSTFPINPVATASSPNSGNSIVYSSLTSAVCSVSGTTVTMLAVGQCTIGADMAGNTNYTAATQVSRSVQLLASVTVGGSVSGLAGTGLVLSLNGGAQTLPVSANGTFAFNTAIVEGAPYNVAVQTQPSSPPQTCNVNNGSGTAGQSNISNIAVNCVTNQALVTLVLPQGVTASPSGNQNVTVGNSLAISLTAPSGYAISSVSGCGGTFAGGVYTTGPITANCSVTVLIVALPVAAVQVTSMNGLGLLLLCLALVGAVVPASTRKRVR